MWNTSSYASAKMMVTSLKLGDNVKEIKDTVVEECVKGNV